MLAWRDRRDMVGGLHLDVKEREVAATFSSKAQLQNESRPRIVSLESSMQAVMDRNVLQTASHADTPERVVALETVARALSMQMELLGRAQSHVESQARVGVLESSVQALSGRTVSQAASELEMRERRACVV